MITLTPNEMDLLPDVIKLMERQNHFVNARASKIDLWRQDFVDIDGRTVKENVLHVRIRIKNNDSREKDFEYICPIWDK